MIKNDYAILRELAKQLAEIAAMPFNEEYRRMWCNLNSLKPDRPMFIIDELPWHELNDDGELTLHCQDPTCRLLENDLRRQLFRYKYLHDDYVFEPYLYVPKKINGIEPNPLTGVPFDYGIEIEEDTIAQADAEAAVRAHEYHDQLETEEDLEKLRCPEISLNEEVTKRREEIANEAVGDILGIRMDGFTPWYNAWDILIMWRSVESVMFALIDDEEFMHKTIRKILDISLQCLNELETQGLIGYPQRQVHCCGVWQDELSKEGYETGVFKAKDVWTYGMGQILYTVSPEKHNEFEFEYAKEWYSKFGLGYYGCCEPLEDRMEYVKQIPCIRKISCSAFVRDYDKFAEQLERKYVQSFKPAPSTVVSSAWNPELQEKTLRGLKASADRYGNPCEFTLKDISTIDRNKYRFGEWSEIMRKIVEE